MWAQQLLKADCVCVCACVCMCVRVCVCACVCVCAVYHLTAFIFKFSEKKGECLCRGCDFALTVPSSDGQQDAGNRSGRPKRFSSLSYPRLTPRCILWPCCTFPPCCWFPPCCHWPWCPCDWPWCPCRHCPDIILRY